MSNRALVAYGDANSITTWNGIPHFFLQAGIPAGFFSGGVKLQPERFRHRRLLWNALRPLTLDKPGGFMYSQGHLRDLWASAVIPPGTEDYVSHLQLLPPPSIADHVTYYIDATLRQYFDEYGRRLGRRIRTEALAQETDAYRAARFVVCWSRWCAEDVEATYGVRADKIRVILPGANLDESSIPPPVDWDGRLSPLRLGIVGFDWERKGGPLLLDAATELQRRGYRVEVVAIGPPASSLPSHPALRVVGPIDKRRDLGRFVELVRSFHFGCLLSRAEALGISVLECVRLGVPVIGTAVGGIADAIPRDAGLLIPVDEALANLVDSLAGILDAPERYGELRAAAAHIAQEQSWNRTVREFIRLFDE